MENKTNITTDTNNLNLLNEAMALEETVRAQKERLKRKKAVLATLVGASRQQQIQQVQRARVTLPTWEKVQPKVGDMEVVQDEKSNEGDNQDIANQVAMQAKEQAMEANRQRLLAEEKRREQEENRRFSLNRNKKKPYSLVKKVMTGTALAAAMGTTGASLFPVLFNGLS